MAYADYSRASGKDDMQDDTFKVLIGYSMEIDRAYMMRDPGTMLSMVEIFYGYVRNRMDKEDRVEMKERINHLKDMLYSPDYQSEEPPTVVNSIILDELRDIRDDLLSILDTIGILFKARADLDSLVTRPNV